MLFPTRIFPGDEELGKKDDDHRPGDKKIFRLGRGYPNMYALQRRFLKRAAYGILGLIILYFLFKSVSSSLQHSNLEPGSIYTDSLQSSISKIKDVVTTSILPEKQSTTFEYNGAIKFHHLTTALTAPILEDNEAPNQNVLFAAANIKSAAKLLLLACEMAAWKRNNLHFAIMGRDTMPLNILKSANGVNKNCQVTFHDGRPDHSSSSSEFRMQASVSAAFKKINGFINPHATLVDGSGIEETWFLKSLKSTALDLSKTIIELPQNTEENLRWILQLDSRSLRDWNQISIEIIIHAQTSASGSLIRLLESLKKADYLSMSPPHLTIELPHYVEEQTSKYLQNFRWPAQSSPIEGNLLSVHHRIPQNILSADESAIRVLESFWPTNPYESQVLVLSPQAELSPLFFSYLKYLILNYKHGNVTSELQSKLLGISLDLPTTYFNDTTTFIPPIDDEKKSVNFLWQAPNSNACLFFADKWVELHDFVSRVLDSKNRLPVPKTLNRKELSKRYPSWLENVLQLSRLRGYFVLYPNFETPHSLATIHTELYKAPEEYQSELGSDEDLDSVIASEPTQFLELQPKEGRLIMDPLDRILPFEGELPDLNSIPRLSWNGKNLKVESFDESPSYGDQFRREIGGCTDGKPKTAMELSAGDLFCLEDVQMPQPD
ncbi:unnamed protein product [Blumeria hordei]|uniref:Uncharacterized protein n=1 Tax=Blumeria hordei TaxID=2867405 RepID=A0A383UUS7_BLUHO|nr:unnamed protein product [Blumeria hordei]